MKKKDFLWVFLLLFPVTVFAQKGAVRSDLSVQSAGLSKGFSSIELCYDVIGYNFTDRLYANLRYEHSTTLFKEDGTKTYARNHTSVTTSNRKRTTASAYRPESVPVPGGKVPTGNSIAMMPPSMWSSDPAK
ncbi:hypothetical protein [Prevotella denticola]|uniref:hypothetical protein n=1 Tax=Prevotella denticola TaxID=28129 RepID=UPI0028EB31D2|nr:hypothetical protein [Prevotella denticola]